MVHDQAAIQELKSMFAEMKELLQQQVICGCVSVSNLKSITPSRQRLTTDCQKKKKRHFSLWGLSQKQHISALFFSLV